MAQNGQTAQVTRILWSSYYPNFEPILVSQPCLGEQVLRLRDRNSRPLSGSQTTSSSSSTWRQCHTASSKWMSLFQIGFQQIFCLCSPACFAQTEWPSNRPVFAPPSLEMVSTWATWASTEEHLDLPCCLAIQLLPGWVGAGCHTTWMTNIRSAIAKETSVMWQVTTRSCKQTLAE